MNFCPALAQQRKKHLNSNCSDLILTHRHLKIKISSLKTMAAVYLPSDLDQLDNVQECGSIAIPNIFTHQKSRTKVPTLGSNDAQPVLQISSHNLGETVQSFSSQVTHECTYVIVYILILLFHQTTLRTVLALQYVLNLQSTDYPMG